MQRTYQLLQTHVVGDSKEEWKRRSPNAFLGFLGLQLAHVDDVSELGNL